MDLVTESPGKVDRSGVHRILRPPIAGTTHYRADIDGLRAIAVLPVVLFHAGVPGFSGGFVGVDVFFVISGYLITQVLMRTATVPVRQVLADFYLRRARRILPALVVMLAVVAAAALVLLLPTDLERFGTFLALASAFLGNLAAWQQGGYFDAAGASLVHLWSIGIEEQFYLLYPLGFLAGIRYSPRSGTWVLGLLAVASFAACVWASATHPVANYYSPVTRAWELLGGAALAYVGWKGFATRGVNEAVAAGALAMLGLCFTFFDGQMRHPGLVTLLPCGATALLLATAASMPTFAARFLMLRPLVFTGLISYSLYLWHAPILSLVRYFLIFEPSDVLLGLELAGIYLLAAASWRWVELPVRSRARLRDNRRFAVIFAGASLALCALGAWIVLADGLPRRFDPEIRRLASTARELDADAMRCMTLSNARIARGELCSFGVADASAPSVVVWGDSHALALLPAYRVLAEQNRLRLMFAARSACQPLLSSSPVTSPRAAGCRDFNLAMLAALDRLDPEVLILNGFWEMPEGPAGPSALRRIDAADFREELQATVARISAPDRRICAVLGAPVHSQIVPYALAMAQRRDLPLDFMRLTRARAFEQHAVVDGVFHEFQRRGALALVDPKTVLCAQEECRFLSDDGWPLYRDTNHLSSSGARMLVPPLASCIRAAR